MTKSLDVFKIEERVKVSYLKHGGNVIEVMKELQLPEEYVKRTIDKLKKKESRDVNTLISNTLSSYILMGYETRKVHYLQVMRELESSGKVKLSICCETPAIRVKDSVDYGHEDYECSMCHERCNIREATFSEIYRIKKEILEQLREEDRLLIDFAEKMGYTKVPVEPTTRINQNIIVMDDGKDNNVIKEIQDLKPKDRDRLLDRLNMEIITTDVEKSTDKDV